jgi:pimeloyl-ACP methyl ester carboxylesterase
LQPVTNRSRREQSTNDLPAGFNPGTLTFNRNYTISGNLLTLTNDLAFVNAGFTGSLVCNAPLKLGNSIRVDQAESSPMQNGTASWTTKALEIGDHSITRRTPARYARRGNPPMLLIHGSVDCFISPMQSENLYGTLTHAGVDATLHTIDGIDHDSTFWSSESAFAEVERFLERSLKAGGTRGRAVRH